MAYMKFELPVPTQGRGSYRIDDKVQRFISNGELEHGLVNLFIQHTSASLMICENADPAVRQDLETFMADLVPDGDARFIHKSEGPDDMPAHIRSILTRSDLTLPVMSGKILLGIWQGIYLWEHRTATHQRKVIISLTGDFRAD